MYADFVEGLRKKIAERIADTEQSLGKGSAQEFAAYREKVGEIRGLRAAADLAKELLKATEEDIDDDDL